MRVKQRAAWKGKGLRSECSSSKLQEAKKISMPFLVTWIFNSVKNFNCPVLLLKRGGAT